MTSTFHGIEMGKRTLITHTQALNVIGQNLNNVNTEGYSRQEIHLSEYEPIYMPDLTREERPGQLGQGAETADIVRVRDQLLDNRLINEYKNLGYYDVKNKYLEQMEMVYSEPNSNNDPNMINTLRTAFNDFMMGWEDLSNHPDENASRISLVEKANLLSSNVRHHFQQLTDIRNNVNKDVKDRVEEINILAEKIGNLNDRILKSETMKDNPNDLLDQRDLLIDRLSKIADIQISREDKNELNIVHRR